MNRTFSPRRHNRRSFGAPATLASLLLVGAGAVALWIAVVPPAAPPRAVLALTPRAEVTFGLTFAEAAVRDPLAAAVVAPTVVAPPETAGPAPEAPAPAVAAIPPPPEDIGPVASEVLVAGLAPVTDASAIVPGDAVDAPGVAAAVEPAIAAPAETPAGPAPRPASTIVPAAGSMPVSAPEAPATAAIEPQPEDVFDAAAPEPAPEAAVASLVAPVPSPVSEPAAVAMPEPEALAPALAIVAPAPPAAPDTGNPVVSEPAPDTKAIAAVLAASPTSAPATRDAGPSGTPSEPGTAPGVIPVPDPAVVPEPPVAATPAPEPDFEPTAVAATLAPRRETAPAPPPPSEPLVEPKPALVLLSRPLSEAAPPAPATPPTPESERRPIAAETVAAPPASLAPLETVAALEPRPADDPVAGADRALPEGSDAAPGVAVAAILAEIAPAAGAPDVEVPEPIAPEAAPPVIAAQDAGTPDAASPPSPAVAPLAPTDPAPAATPEEAWLAYARPAELPAGRPLIVVVVTGLGQSRAAATAAVRMPGAVTLGFVSYARDLQKWIDLARAGGHEVVLDLPMEPERYPAIDPGPQALFTTLPNAENLDRLSWHLGRATGYIGVTHNMGSRFTASADALGPVLAALKARGLMYLDARTSSRSVGGALAAAAGLPHAVNDRFLDAEASRPAIDRRLAEVERIARRRGLAVTMGQAFPVTLARLEEWLPTLEAKGFTLAPLSAVVRRQAQR
ncbi:MAG: divergent polysaccharide deacetylase family protein [Alphaproteobacteria bacterium]